MKVCFIGTGSIGRRHIRNLKKILGEQVEIHVFRHKEGKPIAHEIAGLIAKEIFDYADAEEKYDAVFVANPTVMHFDTIRKWWDRAEHFFVEKPVYDSLEYDDSMFREDKVYVACPLRFSSVYQYIKEFLSGKRVISARAISSSYLPDWRPEQDYRMTYSAKRELGGGVNIDLVHEWDYVIDLFGMPEYTIAYSGKYSALDITSNDLSVGIAGYSDKLIEIHLDYFGRPAVRTLELYLDDEKILADFIKGSIIFERSCQVIDLSEDVNEMYMREMKYYLRLLAGEAENVNSLGKAKKVLQTALGGVG